MKEPGSGIGPFNKETLVYKTPHFIVQPIRDANIEQARAWMYASWRNVSAYQKEWRTMTKSLSAGVFAPLDSRGVFFGSKEGKTPSRGIEYSYYPLLLNELDGQWWGMMSCSRWMDDRDQLESSLRDLLTSKHSSSITSIMTVEQGKMLWQNASSMELYGCHGNAYSTESINFLDLLFGADGGSQSLHSRMKTDTAKGGTFRCTIEVTNPALRALCQLSIDEEKHLDCQVTQTQDPKSLKKVYILCQSDVTETVLTCRRLEQTQKSLEMERAKLDAAMQKQSDLIECLRWVGTCLH